MLDRPLIVGDVHATPDELTDCQALMTFVEKTAVESAASHIILLGDNYHTHNLIRVEVMAFWREVFARLKARGIPVYALVGNHDYAGEGQLIHAMMAHEHVVTVVDRPTVVGPALCLPYYADREAFVRDANDTDRKILVCHQTFEGSKYENGFFASDGVSPNLLSHKLVISGHIHTPQGFKVPNGPEVTYIGAPRWRTASDANIDRAIVLYDFAGDAVATPFDTGTICRQIRMITDTPKFPVALPLDPRAEWRIDIHGPANWVEARKAELSGPGVRVRTFPTKSNHGPVRESEGISVAFRGYLRKFQPKFGTPTARLEEMSQERLRV